MFFCNRIRNIFSLDLSPTSTLNKVIIPRNKTKHSLKYGYIFSVLTIDGMYINGRGRLIYRCLRFCGDNPNEIKNAGQNYSGNFSNIIGTNRFIYSDFVCS